MPNTLEINSDIYSALVESFGKEALKEKIDDILISAMEGLLEKQTREILKFEEKYGVSFQEFNRMWDKNEVADKHNYKIESDFMDWEMLEMEKKDILLVLSKTKNFKKK